LKAFAEETSTSSRSLVIAKYESAANEAQQTEKEPAEEEEKSEGKTEASEPQGEKSIEIVFSASVEFLGSSAMTIAFLKREGYRQLDLRAKEKPEN
jgi:DNA-directed RNA polymerase alpha subunit